MVSITKTTANGSTRGSTPLGWIKARQWVYAYCWIVSRKGIVCILAPLTPTDLLPLLATLREDRLPADSRRNATTSSRRRAVSGAYAQHGRRRSEGVRMTHR